jgi:hypothetical protein
VFSACLSAGKRQTGRVVGAILSSQRLIPEKEIPIIAMTRVLVEVEEAAIRGEGQMIKDRQKERLTKWVSVAVLLALLVIAGTPCQAQRIPEDVKSAVAFVLAPKPGGNTKPVGTGFFVEVKNSKPELSAVYFVTNKHVLLQAEDSPDLRSTLDVRLNAKDGKTTKTFSTNLVTRGKDRNVFFHSKDPAVDLAVVLVEPDRGKYEFNTLSADLITTKDQYSSLQIAEGSKVFFAGLFWQFTGERRNYPIVRFGRVAMVTDERVPVDKKGTTAELYLVEASYGRLGWNDVRASSE